MSRLPRSTRHGLTVLEPTVGGAGPRPLAEVTPAEVLDVAALEAREGRWVAPLVALRDALVFAPLVFTWYHLAAAVRADRALEAAEREGTTFLDRWRGGFEGGATRLDDVASSVVALLTAVVVASLVVAVAEGVGQAVSRRRVGIVRTAATAVAESWCDAAAGGVGGPVDDATVVELTRGLDATAKVVGDLAATLTTPDGRVTVGEAIVGLQQAVAGLDQAARRLATSESGAVAAAEAIAGSVAGVEAGAGRVLAAADDLTSRVSGLIETVDAQSRSHSALADSLREATEALGQEVTVLKDEAVVTRRIMADVSLLDPRADGSS